MMLKSPTKRLSMPRDLATGCTLLPMTQTAHSFHLKSFQLRNELSQRTCIHLWLLLQMPCILVWEIIPGKVAVKIISKLTYQRTGEDVGVYATGPGSNLVQGVFEQSYIPYIISYSSCIGPLSNRNPACLGQKITSGCSAKWSKQSTVIAAASLLFVVFQR